MPFRFRASAPDDTIRVSRFLRDVFHSDTTFADPVNLEWKYHCPRADWEGSRSYVLERDGELVAHGGAWPFQLQWPGGSDRGLHLIDWAADPRVPGAGISLLHHMTSLAALVCSFGGSGVTNAILPKFGFRLIQRLRAFARPLRPWRQIRTHQYRNYKLPARLVRNWIWSRIPRLRCPSGWTATPIAPAKLPEPVCPGPQPDRLVCRRSTALFEYLLRCPVAVSELYLLEKRGAPAGYACLSLVPGQARIADVWVPSQTVEDYAAAYALAALLALERHQVAEIAAFCSTEVAARALALVGYRMCRTGPVLLYRKPSVALPDQPCDFQMIDSDAAYLHPGRPQYLV